jgi:UDP-N-acetylmuramate dehydrogenase
MTPLPGINKLQQAFDLAAGVPMARYTRFRVGGPADLVALPQTRQELTDLLAAATKAAVPVTIVGGGCNLLVSDRGIRGLVVVTTQLKSGIRSKVQPGGAVYLSMEAGERLSTVCRYAVTHGLAGLEFCAGIPGTMGGAVMMNAGTADQSIGDHIHCLDVLDLNTLAIKTVKKKDLVFSYRCLALKNHLIIRITLALTPGDPERIRQGFEAALKRKQSHPAHGHAQCRLLF